jgi:DnaJ-domain-containing protein 1
MNGEEVLRLVRTLAAHPVIPPVEELPADGEAFRWVLADLARGEGSSHMGSLRAVSAELRVPLQELARRAGFILACLLLPLAGTHYEVLGVAPNATAREIRERWGVLIRRYHPDRFGGAAESRPWLDAQARRLIAAYHTVKDPGRRRAYDAQLTREVAGRGTPVSERRAARAIEWYGPTRWGWAPASIAAIGMAMGIWVLWAGQNSDQPRPAHPVTFAGSPPR